MTTTPSSFPFFVTGGTLPNEAPSYVSRQADEELFHLLQAGQFGYVLDSRQVGKSSLIVRAAARLRAEGHAVVMLDLSGNGQHLALEQWYFGLLYGIGDQIGLEEELEQFWWDNQALGPAARWFAALRQVILKQLPGHLIIFIDEIDAVLSLAFSVDEFFAGIRECYNRRVNDQEMNRLIFCLVGVTNPSSLIQDPRTTPFNIGKRIELSDFTQAEAASLARGLRENERQGKALLQRILFWTGGHPYLTQRLCQEVGQDPTIITAYGVDRVCKEQFMTPQACDAEVNLTFVRDRILRMAEGNEQRIALLDLYRQVRLGKRPVLFNGTDERMNILRLSGIVRVLEGRLRVRNRIYAAVFDRQWIQANMPDAELRRQRRALSLGYLRASLVWGLLGGAIFFSMYQSRLAGLIQTKASQADSRAREAIQESGRLTTEVEQARIHLQTVQRKQVQAEGDLKQANQQRTKAIEGLKVLSGRQKIAEQNIQFATQQFVQEKARRIEVARTADAMQGEVASALALKRGSEFAALEFGMHAVEAALREHYAPSETGLQGLADAVNVGIVRRLKLRLPYPVNYASFSPDGKRILAAGMGPLVYIWDASSGKQQQTLQAVSADKTNPYIFSAEFSPDGKYILTLARDGVVRLWDANNLIRHQSQPVKEIPTGIGNPHPVAAFSANGQQIVVSLAGNTAGVWDLTSGKSWKLLGGHEKVVQSVACTRASDTRSGNCIVTTSDDGIVKVWDLATGAFLQKQTPHIEPHDKLQSFSLESGGLCARFANDLVLSGGRNGIAVSWNWKTRERHRLFQMHHGWVRAVDASADHLFVATAGNDRTVVIWNLGSDFAPLYLLNSHTSFVTDVRFNPRGHEIVTASNDQTVEVWTMTQPVFPNTGAAMNYAEFMPQQKEFVCAGSDGLALYKQQFFRGSSLKTTFGEKLAPYYQVNEGKYLAMYHKGDQVFHATFSPEGRWIATGTKSGRICLWAKRFQIAWATQPEKEFIGHQKTVMSVDFSPDARYLVSSSLDNTIRLWEIETGKSLFTWRLPGVEICSARFSPDGNKIASACKDGGVRIWNVASKQNVMTLLPPGRQLLAPYNANHPWQAAFSPEGRYVISADQDHKAYIWEVATGKLIARLQGHSGILLSAYFSSDGQKLVTASTDNTIRLWDFLAAIAAGKGGQPGHSFLTIATHNEPVFSARFSPDGQQVITASRDGTCRLFPATAEGYMQKAKEILALKP